MYWKWKGQVRTEVSFNYGNETDIQAMGLEFAVNKCTCEAGAMRICG